ncbi:Rieske (2Fe-2S) protein [uncultured Agrococcus sp.]|uniref:Rieske (2Fe-2S) protein n=1 Tax=uncultured Agrococcus sp. TaxID=382258 RepID=UPI0025D787EF|nr:Rieske (2Fe-2S) protein [uncultured Agrococcus sp.]
MSAEILRSTGAERGAITRRAAIGACVAGGVLTLAACAGGVEFVELPSGENGSTAIPLDDIPVGGGGSLQIDQVAVIVTRPTETEVHAFSGHCTHQGCLVRMNDENIHCPCHNSEFDTSTGDVVTGPALEALPEYRVDISGSEVTVYLDPSG